MPRTNGDEYRVDPEEKAIFFDRGYVHLKGVLSETELLAIEHVYDRFLKREIEVPGRDYCDMSGDYGRDPSEFAIFNVMLPRRYYPAWQGNLFERRARSIASQLQGEGLAIDYDQLLAKPPSRKDGVFHWHQDMAYWPETPDPRTATLWLALDDATVENGCMRFVAGTHKETTLRPHAPLTGDRSDSHSLVARLADGDEVSFAEIKRGDVTVHQERVLHGSGPNTSAGWRRAYVVAFRSEAAIAAERQMGFTHSHNDEQDIIDFVARKGKL